MDDKDVEALAAKLTKAQRAVVMSLPADGDFGKAADARCARRMWWGIQREHHRLIEHRHLTDNCWCLNSFGLAVREILLKDQSNGQ